MKKIYWIILIIVVLLIIGYFTNWFGLKKSKQKEVLSNERRVTYVLPNNQTISCGSGCILSTNVSGASQTVTVGNVTYTCRCTDGSTSSPIINN